MKSLRSLAFLFGLTAAFAFAQDPETAPAAQPQEESEAAAEEESKPGSFPTLEVAWSDWNLSGNRNKFLQYATPAEGFYLRDFAYSPWWSGLRHGASLRLMAPGEPSSFARGMVSLGFGRTRLTGSYRTDEFFSPSPAVLTESDRKISEGVLRHNFSRDLSIGFRAKRDEQDNFYEPPKDDIRQRTYTHTASLGGKVLGGFGELSLTNYRYYDRTNVLPDTKVQLIGANYTVPVNDALNVEGSFYRSTLEPDGGPENDVETIGASADWAVGDRTMAFFDYRREKIDMPFVANNYVRDRTFVRGRVLHRFRNWNGQFSYRRLDVERVRSDQSFVDAPTYHTFEGKVSGKLSPSVRLNLRAVRETLDGRFGMTTDDPRALYWRNRLFAQVGLDATTDTTNAYLVVTFNENRNDARDSRVRNVTATLGASANPAPNLDLYFEATNDDWSARTDDPDNVDLGLYFPNGQMFTLGANWSFSEDAYASLNYTEFLTQNRNPLLLPQGNVRGRFLTAGLHLRSAQGYEIGLSFAPWKFTDKYYSQHGFDATLLTVSASLRF